MKFPTAFLTLFLTLAVVNASSLHDSSLGARYRHSRHQVAAAMSALEKKSPPQRRCPRRGTGKGSGSSKNVGKILIASGKCGPSNAVASPNANSGPNGSIEYLNCGIDGDGWSPPPLDIKDVVVKPLSDAIKSPNSPFHACKKFVPLFNKYGDEFGVPPIFLASFAMQESSCRPETIGGAGEQGLMQLTKDKCGGAPRGDCRNPDYNIRTGAKYFASTLADVGGDVLLAIGRYNGWYPGLTKSKAEAARHNGCCRCQQNLDYLHQFLNGWCQNINAYDHKLGIYFNLNMC